jgi:hypothetical protein
MQESFSVSLRLRRVTTETAHISVPLTKDLLRLNPENPDTAGIDTDKLTEAAILQGQAASTARRLEGEPQITLHPIQTTADSGAPCGPANEDN